MSPMPDQDENAAFERTENPTTTERATHAAIPEQQGGEYPAAAPTEESSVDYPDLGERDGRFYVRKGLGGTGEIPDHVHEANLNEVATVARNNGYEVPTTMHPQVDHAERTQDGWVVTYSVKVTGESHSETSEG
jgi:hypothetical protein